MIVGEGERIGEGSSVRERSGEGETIGATTATGLSVGFSRPASPSAAALGLGVSPTRPGIVIVRRKSSSTRPKWRPRWALEMMITDKHRAITASMLTRLRSDLTPAVPRRRPRITAGLMSNSDYIARRAAEFDPLRLTFPKDRSARRGLQI